MENVKPIEDMTEAEKQERIGELYAKKRELLDQYGIFGGGIYVNRLHLIINQELELLGIDPNS